MIFSWYYAFVRRPSFSKKRGAQEVTFLALYKRAGEVYLGAKQQEHIFFYSDEAENLMNRAYVTKFSKGAQFVVTGPRRRLPRRTVMHYVPERPP